MNKHQINEKVRTLAGKTGDRIQNRAFVAAGVVDGAKRPARKLNSAGKRLNDLTHRFYARMLEQQIKGIEDVVNAGATRLKRVGDAASMRELVRNQIELFPANRALLIGNLRNTAGIIGETGREIADLAKSTVVELKGGKAVRKPAAKPAKQASPTKATSKSAAGKAATKAPARKKKTATRKAV